MSHLINAGGGMFDIMRAWFFILLLFFTVQSVSWADSSGVAVSAPSLASSSAPRDSTTHLTQQHWVAFSAKTTPRIDLAGFETLIQSHRAIDAVVDLKSPRQAIVFLRMDNGAAWQLDLPALQVPIVMQKLMVAKIRTGVVTSFAYNEAMQHAGDDVWRMILLEIPVGQIIGQTLFILFVAGILVWVQMRAGRMFAAKRIKPIAPRDIEITFDDVAGVDEAVRDMREAVAFLGQPQDFERLGARLPKGILLVGPPGGGKTMLAKAFAKACNVPFYAVSGSEFVEMYVGLGAARIRSLFKKARKAKKAVVFIDEIDTLARKRGAIHSHSEAEQTLNELLVQMDGLTPNKGQIIVIAATNRVDAMDEAILRPGRFDRQIHVEAPSLKGREDILRVYLKDHLHDDIDVRQIARLCVGFSGAQLANLVNEALIGAARAKRDRLTQADLLAARDKILLGDPRKDLQMTEQEMRTTAIHEAGHAVIAHIVSRDPVEKVTIEPRSRALGLMLQVPERDAVSVSASEIHAKLLVLLAGRAAEEVFLSDVTTGAANDMERAFALALRMVSQWGMGRILGPSGVSDLSQLSAGLREAVEREARDTVQQAYAQVVALVREHQDKVRIVADTLLKEQTIDRATFLHVLSLTTH